MYGKLICTLGMVLMLSFTLHAQEISQEKMKDSGVVAGAIIKNGQRIDGFIKEIHKAYSNQESFDNPWDYQKEILFITVEELSKLKKVKRKYFEKFRAKDIDGYVYDSLEYISVKYADLTAVGPGMLPRQMFLRKVVDGPVSIYHHFNSPPAVASGPEGFKPYYLECAKPTVVYRIGDQGKPRPLNSLNIKKELADCPHVIEKYESGQYGDEDEKTGKLIQFAGNTLAREQLRVAVISDYNTACN